MTCIAGLVHDGQVWLASDLQTSWGSMKFPCERKIIQHGDFAVACCGWASIGHAFQDRLSLPDIPEDESKHDKWMRVAVPDAMKSAANEAGIMEVENNVKSVHGAFIMAWRGRLATMCGSLAVDPVTTGYTALGSGGDVAIGSLFSTEGKEPEERLRIAINAANMWSVGCGCDVHVVKVGGH